MVLALALAGGMSLHAGYAQSSRLDDAWLGDKLDPKWRVTVLGDAQNQESSVKVESGALRIRAAGSDIWDARDNGIFVWQPINGDFEVLLEMRGLRRTDPSAKVGIMVRTSLDVSSPNVFLHGMPTGGALQSRAEPGGSTGPGSDCPGENCNPWGDPNTSDLGNMPTILQRLTRKGNVFTAERSYDGGRTWVGLRKGPSADRDRAEVKLPDDVLVGIAMTSRNPSEVGEALLGPNYFGHIAFRYTDNGLVVGTATGANGKPVPGVGLIVKRGSETVGSSTGSMSNTASFFLKPGQYTIQTAETDGYAAGAPVSFEIKTGEVVDLKVPAGKPK
jgi:hypothetical protein